MFVEKDVSGVALNGESCPTVDVMKYCWTGSWPANRAPQVSGLTLDGKKATQSVTLSANRPYSASVTAADPENDELTFIWEILEEPTDLGEFGSYEPRPARAVPAITSKEKTIPLPGMDAGRYILFVYVLDNQGHAGTANIPFRVR